MAKNQSQIVYSPKQKVIRVLLWLLLVFISFLVIFPVLYIILGSFKENQELLVGGSNIFPQQWIVRGRRQIQHPLSPVFHLVAQRLEDVPVSPAVGKEHDFLPAGVRLSPGFRTAAEEEFRFGQHVPQGIDQRAEQADQNGEQHAARAGIDV